MVTVCLYFQVHQPLRLRHYPIFDIGRDHNYFNERKNLEILERVSRKCYLPMNRLLLDLIQETDGALRLAFSITGVALDQFESHKPEVLESFEELAATGCVEFLNETYYHSLSAIYSEKEFEEQVELHRKRVEELFDQRAEVFRNTELIYNNRIAYLAERMGYRAVLVEGAGHILGWRSPNFLYKAKMAKDIKLLPRNYRLSDDISFRFSRRDWDAWPLTAEKFATWIDMINGDGEVVNIFLDYETFGEHQWPETGIFEFFRRLPFEVLKSGANDFKTPSEIVESYEPVGELDVRGMMSWADVERDLTAWLGNDMQKAAAKRLYSLEEAVKGCGDEAVLRDWRLLQTADHLYYMCTKWFADGDVHKYFNPYDSPYDCFISFMNVLEDLELRAK